MIARIWRGVTSAEQAEEHKEFLLELEPKVTHYEYESH
jgi:hypothetical protein